MLLEGQFRYVDTFLDPSNMTRGMTLRRQKKLDRMLKSGKLVLRSTLGNKYVPDKGPTVERLRDESSLTQSQNESMIPV
jgi:hypothetical protein